MACRIIALLALLAVGTGAKELTSANWDEETAGKSVFIKFLAPWCGHCKKLKPDWDKLIADFETSATAGVFDVDCTTEGKDLCEKHGVSGYPTIKYGDPGELKDYQGGRTYADLKKFADENLGPNCGPDHLDLCDAKTKEKVEGYMKMSADRIDGKIKNAERIMEVEMPIMKKVLGWLKKGGKKEGGEL